MGKKSSAYWVATTHVQYNLDMADINIAANRTADAKANMDSAAAAYFGCGDTNPVPLPKYKGTQIAYPTAIDGTDIGSNATTMSIYGVANKRASNYKTAVSVPDKTASATSPGTTKTVAELNIEVGTALNAATPTAATVQTVRDSVNTIFAQAAQRYIAKITLAAHLPGNGMGGSTNPSTTITDPATNPQTGYWTSGAWGIWAKKSTPLQQATACGGISTQMPQKESAADTGAVASDTSLKMNGGLACSKLTTGAGSAVSNTALVRTVQPEVRQSGSGTGLGAATVQDKPGQQNPPDFGTGGGAKSILPYQVLMTVGENVAAGATTATALGLEGRNGGLTNEQIKKATRGLPQTATLGMDFDKSTPTACIGPSVIFNDVPNSGAAAGIVAAAATKLQQGVALCDPFGFAPAQKTAAINNAASEVPLPSATATFAKNKEYYSGTGNAAATAGVKLNVQKFWDPITAAQASGGAFCCDALYYGAD